MSCSYFPRAGHDEGDDQIDGERTLAGRKSDHRQFHTQRATRHFPCTRLIGFRFGACASPCVLTDIGLSKRHAEALFSASFARSIGITSLNAGFVLSSSTASLDG